jgi:hypothetical protein
MPLIKFKAIALLVLTVLTIGVAATSAEERASEIPPGEPTMKTEGQVPSPRGGRVILYSRSRHGNYPLASYTFSRGLRGDDKTVHNDVDLVFGNVQRENAFRGRRVDAVLGAGGNGAPALDGGGAGAKDQFRVGLFGGVDHGIVDLGKVDFNGLTHVPPTAKTASATRVGVQVDHVYLLRLIERTHRHSADPAYVKLRVLRHRDNDAVLIEWEPLAG